MTARYGKAELRAGAGLRDSPKGAESRTLFCEGGVKQWVRESCVAAEFGQANEGRSYRYALSCKTEQTAGCGAGQMVVKPWAYERSSQGRWVVLVGFLNGR